VDAQWAISELERTLGLLASPASKQIAYLRKLGTAPETDELALEFDDVAGVVQTLISEGYITASQGQAIGEVDRILGQMSDQHDPSLWIESALSTTECWNKVRQAAKDALASLKSGVPTLIPPTRDDGHSQH
jgi:hypothetical protein